MRFGSRGRDDEGRTPPPVPHTAHPIQPANSPPQVPSLERAVPPSKRLQRIAEHFHQQGELLAAMREQFDAEMTPMQDLLVRQAQAMHRLLANLDERLRPLNEYADGEEANLHALESRISAGGPDHVARAFQPYLEDQRSRINSTRTQIEQQRIPFVQYGEDAREAVEVALSRFDHDMDALEQTLAEQRRVMMRMLDAMRSESFAAVKAYLDGRQEAVGQIAGAGSTDPQEIGRAMQTFRTEVEGMARQSDHIKQVLDKTDLADRQLVSVSVVGPRAMQTPPAPAMPAAPSMPSMPGLSGEGDGASAASEA